MTIWAIASAWASQRRSSGRPPTIFASPASISWPNTGSIVAAPITTRSMGHPVRPAAGCAVHLQQRRLCDLGFAAAAEFRDRPLRPATVEPELNFTLGVDWQATPRAKVHFDAQYLKSYYNADRNGNVLTLFTAAGQNTPTGSPHPSIIDFDLRGKRPQWDVRDKALLTNPANYATSFIADALQRNDADTLALAYDIEYDLEGGVLKKLRGGARYSGNTIDLRGTWNGVCLYATGPDPTCSAKDGTPLIPLTRNPQLSMPAPSSHFFDGRSVTGGLLSGLPGRQQRRDRQCLGADQGALCAVRREDQGRLHPGRPQRADREDLYGLGRGRLRVRGGRCPLRRQPGRAAGQDRRDLVRHAVQFERHDVAAVDQEQLQPRLAEREPARADHRSVPDALRLFQGAGAAELRPVVDQPDAEQSESGQPDHGTAERQLGQSAAAAHRLGQFRPDRGMVFRPGGFADRRPVLQEGQRVPGERHFGPDLPGSRL